MGFEAILLGLWAVIASGAAFLFWQKSNAMAPATPVASGAAKASLPASKSPASDDVAKGLEKKLNEARSELSTAKEKLQAKQKELEDLKEQARQKAKREGKKEAREAEPVKKGPDPRDVEIQSLRKGMAALESQLNSLKREKASSADDASAQREKSAAEMQNAKEAAAGERGKRENLESENQALKATIDELRATIKKVDARPDVPGTALNLKDLPTPAVQELARFFRKGEEFERLYTVAQSQLQLEKDRYLELQRRYFAVCREMAVKTGAPVNASDADIARATHEALEEAQAAGAPTPTPSTETAVEARETPAGEGGEKKKRRRRRRRKVVGESAEVEVDGDEGDDGDDEGDDLPESDDAVAASSDASGDAADTDKGAGDSGASAPA